MKVTNTPPILPAAATQRSRGKAKPASGRPGLDRVTLSPGAKAMKLVRSAERPGAVRQDIVDQVRTQLANGTFEQSIDWGRMAGGLLAEL